MPPSMNTAPTKLRNTVVCGSGTRYSTLPSSSVVPPSGCGRKSPFDRPRRVRIAELDASIVRNAHVPPPTLVAPRTSVGVVDRENARPELILGVAAHRVGAAGVEALARMEHAAVGARRDRLHPSRAADAPRTRCFVPLLCPYSGGVEEDAVVSIVGARERRRVLEVEPRDVALGRRERRVGAVDEAR